MEGGEINKYAAVWVSHSSMGDFLKCPRLYYLHNVYKTKAGRKINITSPALALGVAVHDVLEPLAWLPREERLNQDFKKIYDKAWKPVTGKLGGFKSVEEEKIQKDRGWRMIERVINNPEPIISPALRMGKNRDDLPHYFLSSEDNIILCGKVDWLQYNKNTDSINLIDFKTGKREEGEDSLQLPIYLLLASHFKSRPINKAYYWYIDRDNEPIEKKLPSKEEAFNRVIEVARKVVQARATKEMNCPKGEKGCMHCKPFEKIITGQAEFVGIGGYNQELYIL